MSGKLEILIEGILCKVKQLKIIGKNIGEHLYNLKVEYSGKP